MATGTTQSIPAADDLPRPVDDIDYEKFVTDDDKPVDSVYAERQHNLLTTTLIDSWPGPREGRPFWVCTDVGLFYAVDRPAFAPDVLLSLDVALPAADLKKKGKSLVLYLEIRQGAGRFDRGCLRHGRRRIDDQA